MVADIFITDFYCLEKNGTYTVNSKLYKFKWKLTGSKAFHRTLI